LPITRLGSPGAWAALSASRGDVAYSASLSRARDDARARWVSRVEHASYVALRLPDGTPHSPLDVPAVIYADGARVWYRNGAVAS